MKAAALAAVLGLLAACQRPAPGPALGLPALPHAQGTAASIALGRKLFMDRRLSSNGTMSCAMCHVPEQGFTATELGTALGLEGRTLRRNAPTLLNVAYVGQLFHDGRAGDLALQAWAPLLHPVEMGNVSAAQLLARIRAMPDYAGKFEAAFAGAGPSEHTVGAALADYQRTLVSGNSRFDRWHYGGESKALSAAEQAGFAVFAGKGRCISCHTVGQRSALFSDARFHNTGIGWARSQGIGAEGSRSYKVQLAPGVFTEIRQDALASVSEALQQDDGRFEVTHKDSERWAYRTPTLRNVALTGPYMHDGSLGTIEEVIDYYQHGGIDNPGKDALLRPLQLTSDDKRHLAAFLRTLTGDNTSVLAQQARAERIDHPAP
jgi:cytochrome c peroxidase